MTSVLSIRGFQNAADKSHKSRWSHKSHSCHRPKMSSTSTACCAVGHSASSVESLCEGGRTSTIELHQRIRQDLGGGPPHAAGSGLDLVAANRSRARTDWSAPCPPPRL